MNFFGEAVSNEEVSLVIHPGQHLTIKHACLDCDFAASKAKSGNSSLFVRTARSGGKGIIVCLVNEAAPQNDISLVFNATDSPVTLWSRGSGNCASGVVHVSGTWAGEAVVAPVAAAPAPVVAVNATPKTVTPTPAPATTPVAPAPSKKGARAATAAAPAPAAVPAPVVPAAAPVAAPAPASAKAGSKRALPVEEVAKEEAPVTKNNKKSKKDKAAAAAAAAASPTVVVAAPAPAPAAMEVVEAESAEDLSKALKVAHKVNLSKRWNTKPHKDEGILVPHPKRLMVRMNVFASDVVLGKGIEPKLGAVVKIVYEGILPDGTVFDSCLKAKKPFVFRKGTGQVVRGLDIGLEGLKIGGSREIYVPPELGYGVNGVPGKVPPNTPLVFRVCLVA